MCGHKAFWQKQQVQSQPTLHQTKFIMPYKGIKVTASSNNLLRFTVGDKIAQDKSFKQTVLAERVVGGSEIEVSRPFQAVVTQ